MRLLEWKNKGEGECVAKAWLGAGRLLSGGPPRRYWGFYVTFSLPWRQRGWVHDRRRRKVNYVVQIPCVIVTFRVRPWMRNVIMNLDWFSYPLTTFQSVEETSWTHDEPLLRGVGGYHSIVIPYAPRPKERR